MMPELRKPTKVSVPPELWLAISKVIEPNPIVYINLAQICRSSRTVFQSDTLWRKLVPHETSTGHYYAFEKQLKRKSAKIAADIRKNWLQVLEYTLAKHVTVLAALPTYRGPIDDPDLALSLCLNDSLVNNAKFGILFWKCALVQNPLLFEYAPKQFYTSPELLLYAMLEAGCSPVFLGTGAAVLENLQVSIAAVERSPSVVAKMSTSFLKQNPQILIKAIRFYPWVIIQDSVAAFRDDFDIALEAVSRNGQLLGVLGDSLKRNYDIVYSAVSNYGAALQYASNDLKSDKKLVLKAVSNCGMALKYASTDLRDEKHIVLAAVKENGDSRTFASPKLQYDKDIVASALMAMRR